MIKRDFLVEVLHLRGGRFWDSVNGNIIKENDNDKAIRVCGFDYKLSEEMNMGGSKRVLLSIHI